MVGSATLHTAMAEIVVGSMVLATICAIGCLASRILTPSEINSESLFITMDRASLAGSSLALLFLPVAIMTGNLAAEGHAESALLYNKFVYSGLALGFWSAFVIGRYRMGPGLWDVRQLAILQAATAVSAFLMTSMASSIGGKLVRGESLFDILPFWLPSDSAAILPLWASSSLLLLGLISTFFVFRLTLPRIQEID
ncbi:MAG: hypothetical protein CMA62_03865 [Euryarchaeota archaeon]|nr:hypothetical protein [Euryarchaeota archaeon]DAC45609.1 MAG TPA: hypothetical protein D7H82_05535 [Candidatus Poseidoniales archaeon]HII34339.1 hypothetical protein [Candidatus Thalassarchaeaceae archaeon]|tara:strand:- start:987 stop:1577 length:591 start_codon:yes stop_codon:yes gene_type:complete